MLIISYSFYIEKDKIWHPSENSLNSSAQNRSISFIYAAITYTLLLMCSHKGAYIK
jgi:hypothetical protein